MLLNQDISQARKNAKFMNKNTLRTASSGQHKPHQLNPYCDVHTLLDAFEKFEADYKK